MWAIYYLINSYLCLKESMHSIRLKLIIRVHKSVIKFFFNFFKIVNRFRYTISGDIEGTGSAIIK